MGSFTLTEQIKTGTTTLGIVCKDGIIVAADKRATSGHMIANGNVEKVVQISDRALITIAGTVSDAMLLIKLIKAESKLNKLRLNRANTAKELASLIGSMVYSNIRKMSMIPGITHFLLAAKNDDSTFELYDIFVDGSVFKYETFISSGSGSVFALGVLETLYKKDMTIAEGIQLAKKSLHAAIVKDSASGNGADIYKLTANGVEKVETIIINTGLMA